MLVMVCDFPVPGGPCRMKLLPLPDSTMASICEESTSRGMQKSIGAFCLSMFLASTPSVPGSCASWLPVSEATMAFSFSLSALEWMSFHITNLLNEKSPSIDSSSTSHLFCPVIALRRQVRMSFTSTPLSSFGSCFRLSKLMLKLCFSSSVSVMLRMVSSSRLRMM